MNDEEFFDKCLEEYDILMDDHFFSAKSTPELESHHQSVKGILLEKLPSKWENSGGSSPIPQSIEKQLSQKLESHFMKLKRQYEKLRQREQSKNIGQDALTFYNDEMDKYFRNHPNASPKEIDMAHVKASNAAVTLATKKSASKAHLTSLMEDMEDRRKVYRERAEMILKANRDPAIGIDLGTTNCCVMVFYKGKCELIPNRSQGNLRTTPSYVAFHENNTDTFGYVAKEEAYKYPETTIYDAKRMIGRPGSDEKLQNDKKKWPFKVVSINDQVKIKTWNRLRYPHEVSARLLTRFRLMAEDHLGLARGSIKKAVITVPAYFTEPQRRATNEAAVCAGLEVLNILSEPTAAAIAYSWERRDTGTRTALIYDLGGGTFDIAVAKVTPDNVEILCVDGDTHLGGHDFDQLLMDYCIQEFKKTENIDLLSLKQNPEKTIRDEAIRALSRLKLQCEKVKERLSTADFTNVQVEKIYGTKDLSVLVTKSRMETLVRPLVKKTIDIMERALQEAESKGIQSKADIDDIILVGGSTRMPIVMEMVSNFFDGKQLCKHINPDEAVAHGAAIQAAILNNNDSIKSIQVQDVTPMSIGLKIFEDKFSGLIPRNSKIPCEYKGNYCTLIDDQTTITFCIYQGENPIAKGNKLLGEFTLSGFPQRPAGEEEASATMRIDSNGILHVEAISKTTGKTKSITISADRIGMDKGTMQRVMAECQQIKTY